MASIKELKQTNGALQDKMIAMQKKADDENRKMTKEEVAGFVEQFKQ